MKDKLKKIDLTTIIVPFIFIIGLCSLFIKYPTQSKHSLDNIRYFLGNQCGLYYVMIGCGAVICSLYLAFSKYGKIKLGNIEKPEYSTFSWGAMIFTSTMAADILFYSLIEWALYGNNPYLTTRLGGMQKWAPTYTLFHWGPIAWSFYVVLAVAFGFMIHVRGRDKQKFSEACRPLLGKKVDGPLGKIIDLIAVIALLAGTATTFSLATPLLAMALSNVLHISAGKTLTITILLIVALIYTLTVWFGMKGVSKLATICAYLFFLLLAYVLFLGGETRYILETGFSSIGNLTQNFIGMATWMDPNRKYSFVQNWSIFYWAYWLVWCVATPFFIGKISKGRTIKNTVLGTYGCGLAGTFMSFIVLGNYGLGLRFSHRFDAVAALTHHSMAQVILEILNTLPFPKVVMMLLVITMIIFYATTFDSLTVVISSYSYKELKPNQIPSKTMRTFWSIMFIFLPIALIFAGDSLSNLQSVAIIAAFPVGIIWILITASFFKDANQYLNEKQNK